jgi:oligoendopeptidase F
MPKRALLLLLTVLTLGAHAEEPAGDSDRWDLSALYATDDAWNGDLAKAEAQLPDLAACSGHLGDSAAKLRDCLQLQSDILERFLRLLAYASMRFDEDTGVPASLERRQRVRVLGTRFGEARAFVEPEILAVGRDRIERFVAEDSALRAYAHPLDDVLRKAAHTLDTPREQVIAAFGLTSDTPSTAYNVLVEADLPWPRVRLSDGSEFTLDQSAYTLHREAPQRDDRRKVMDAFFGALRTYERTLGVTLYGQLKQDAVIAKVRGYPDSLSRALDDGRMPRAVYDQLVAQANANLPTLHRYFGLRARMMGIAKLRYYDLYPPLVASQRKYPLAEAKKTIVAADAPLGGDYVAALSKALDARWMDAHPRPRKQSGGYMNGLAYEVHPFLLLNYNDDYGSLSTLAHEWGHAMHSVLANGKQPFPTARYATFVAEIASTLDESLLLDYVLAHAQSDDERLLYLGSALEGLRTTFFRQAMFGEFEREIHARVDRGETLTGDALSRLYLELLRRYHGDAVEIDDAYGIEWAYVSHFYRAFYVYQYATSIAASSLFAQRIVAGEVGARERYLDLLRAGGSDYPYELVKRAGVDLATAAPYEALAARMNAIMDRIEAILAKRR